MFISQVHLQNFRNFENASFSFSSTINCIWGENGTGKSTILEAVFLAITGKSPKAARESELIRFGKNFARVEVRGEKKRGNLLLEAIFETGEENHVKKTLRINRHPIRKLSELLGQMKVVLFLPEDEWLVQGEPYRRRRFLDFLASQISRKYLYDLQQYHSVKEQRNSLLKRPHAKSELEPWNLQLVEFGSQILKKRLELIPELQEKASALYETLSGKKEVLFLTYQSALPLSGDETLEGIREIFRKSLEASYPEESARGITILGPHRDDLEIFLNGKEARLFGSQGQQKTAALSLKFAEGKLFAEVEGEPPIYLLDDCFSLLDLARQEAVQILLQSYAQTFLTFATPPPPFLAPSEVVRLESSRPAILKEGELSSRSFLKV